MNNLLDSKHDGAWKKTKPPGVEGNNLLVVVEKFATTVAGILEEQIERGDLEYFDKSRAEVREHIGTGNLVFSNCSLQTGKEEPLCKNVRLGT